MCLERAKQQSLVKQQVMFREIEKETLLTHQDIARLLDCHVNTVSGWALGRSEMSFGSFRELCRHVEDKHTSIMLEPVGKAVRSAGGDGCFDELAATTAAYQAEHLRARSDNSPGGSQIIYLEKPPLVNLARAVRCAADRVIASNGDAA
jgi:hypothetical protein